MKQILEANEKLKIVLENERVKIFFTKQGKKLLIRSFV